MFLLLSGSAMRKDRSLSHSPGFVVGGNKLRQSQARCKAGKILGEVRDRYGFVLAG
jgi:hypothetical protein